MKKVIRYLVAGRLIENYRKALKLSKYIKEVNKLLNTLHIPKKNYNDYVNGEGYIQLTLKEVNNFFQMYGKLIKKFESNKTVKEYSKTVEGLKGFIGRYLSDNNSPAYILWDIANRIDDNYRLWGQQYYRKHPEEAKDVRINK